MLHLRQTLRYQIKVLKNHLLFYHFIQPCQQSSNNWCLKNMIQKQERLQSPQISQKHPLPLMVLYLQLIPDLLSRSYIIQEHSMRACLYHQYPKPMQSSDLEELDEPNLENATDYTLKKLLRTSFKSLLIQKYKEQS